jgi:hypothetical protein
MLPTDRAAALPSRATFGMSSGARTIVAAPIVTRIVTSAAGRMRRTRRA